MGQGSNRPGSEPRSTPPGPECRRSEGVSTMTRRDIEFGAEDVTLRGWFYPAQGAPGATHATIVMTHGYSAVKEMYLDRYAEVFAAAGLNALVFDNRNFGPTAGEPRQEVDPGAHARGYRHGIACAAWLWGVDVNRTGV